MYILSHCYLPSWFIAILYSSSAFEGLMKLEVWFRSHFLSVCISKFMLVTNLEKKKKIITTYFWCRSSKAPEVDRVVYGSKVPVLDGEKYSLRSLVCDNWSYFNFSSLPFLASHCLVLVYSVIIMLYDYQASMLMVYVLGFIETESRRLRKRRNILLHSSCFSIQY